MKNLYYVICANIENLKNIKMSCILERTLVLSIIRSRCKNEDEKLFKEEKPTEIFKILGLIENI